MLKDSFIEEGSSVGIPELEYDGETLVVNKDTGGSKGQKLARFDLIPWNQMWKVAELYGRGTYKYQDRNWERGYAWSLSWQALMRHSAQFWMGKSIDSENRSHHLSSVIFHALALMEFEETHPELDDRPLDDRTLDGKR